MFNYQNITRTIKLKIKNEKIIISFAHLSHALLKLGKRDDQSIVDVIVAKEINCTGKDRSRLLGLKQTARELAVCSEKHPKANAVSRFLRQK